MKLDFKLAGMEQGATQAQQLHQLHDPEKPDQSFAQPPTHSSNEHDTSPKPSKESSQESPHGSYAEKPNSIREDATVVIDSPSSKSEDQKDDKAKKKDGGYGYYVKLWTYSTPIDVLLRVVAFFAACGAGAALPLMTIIFGRLVNDFNAFGSGGPPDSLRAAVNKNGLWFLYLFIAKFTLVYIHTSCFTITAVRATRTIRQEYIRSLLRQDIAYFDTCTPGSVATSISNNADMIQNGMSEKVGTIIQGLAMLTSAFIVAFVNGWKLTLVGFTFLYW